LLGLATSQVILRMAGGSVGEEDAQRLFHVCDTSNSLAAVNLTRYDYRTARPY
jgi:hypothetical protein